MKILNNVNFLRYMLGLYAVATTVILAKIGGFSPFPEGILSLKWFIFTILWLLVCFVFLMKEKTTKSMTKAEKRSTLFMLCVNFYLALLLIMEFLCHISIAWK